MYQAQPDPYCYPGTNILRNKAGLTSADALEQFETAMTFARSEEPLPAGRLSGTQYRAIHHHLFQDVYDWAGRFRTVRLAKGASPFCYPENIGREMRRLFDWLGSSTTSAISSWRSLRGRRPTSCRNST